MAQTTPYFITLSLTTRTPQRIQSTIFFVRTMCTRRLNLAGSTAKTVVGQGAVSCTLSDRYCRWKHPLLCDTFVREFQSPVGYHDSAHVANKFVATTKAGDIIGQTNANTPRARSRRITVRVTYASDQKWRAWQREDRDMTHKKFMSLRWLSLRPSDTGRRRRRDAADGNSKHVMMICLY